MQHFTISCLLLIAASCWCLFHDSAGLKLSGDPKIVVTEGEPLEVWCPEAVGAASSAPCHLQIPGFNSTIVLSQGGSAAGQPWTPLGDLAKGECGVRLEAARRRHAGRATCTHANRTFELQIEVVWPPTKVEMNASNKFYEFWQGHHMNFSCSVEGASPHANVSILLDNVLMAWNTEETVVQWGRQAEAADNMKNIKCKVQHPALKTAAERARTIEVKFGPMKVNQTESVQLGANASLSLNVKANPVVSQAEWTVNGKALEHQRFSPWNTTNPSQGFVTFGLKIIEVSQQDYLSMFRLNLSNEVASETFQLQLKRPNKESRTFLVVLFTLIVFLSMIIFGTMARKWSKNEQAPIPLQHTSDADYQPMRTPEK